MKKTILVLALLAAAGAHATSPTPTPAGQSQYANIGITSIAAAGAFAHGGSAYSAGGAGGTGTGGIGYGGAGGLGGAGGIGGASSIGNVMAGGLDMSGARIGSNDNYYQRQTPPSYAPQGDKPRVSCRLFLGGGAASPGGSASGAIPIGNDAVCLHEKRDAVMTAANARPGGAGTFGADDFLRNDCTVEGMGETAACKALAQRDQQRASSSSTSSRTASLNLLP